MDEKQICNLIKMKNSSQSNKFYECKFCSRINFLDRYIICKECLVCHQHKKEEIRNLSSTIKKIKEVANNDKVYLKKNSITSNLVKKSTFTLKTSKEINEKDINEELISEEDNYIVELKEEEYKELGNKICYCFLNLHRTHNKKKDELQDKSSNIDYFGNGCNFLGRIKFINNELGKNFKSCDFCYEVCGLKNLNYEIKIELGSHYASNFQECKCTSKNHESIKNLNNFCFGNQLDDSFFCENTISLIEQFNEKFSLINEKHEGNNLNSIMNSFIKAIEKDDYSIYTYTLKLINILKGIKNPFILRNEELKIFSLLDEELVLGSFNLLEYQDFLSQLCNNVNLNVKISFEKELNISDRRRTKMFSFVDKLNNQEMKMKQFHFFNHVFLLFLLTSKIKLKLFIRNYFIMSNPIYNEISKDINKVSFYKLISNDDSDLYFNPNKFVKIFKMFIKISDFTLKNYIIELIISILSLFYKGNFNNEDINSLICLNYSIFSIFKIIKTFLKYFSHFAKKKLLLSIINCLNTVFQGFSIIIKNYNSLEIFFKSNFSNIFYRSVILSIKIFKLLLEISNENQILLANEKEIIFSLFFTALEITNTLYSTENISLREINSYIDQIMFHYFGLKENPSYDILINKEISKYLFTFFDLEIIFDSQTVINNLSKNITQILKEVYKDLDILNILFEKDCTLKYYQTYESLLDINFNKISDHFNSDQIKKSYHLLLYNFFYLMNYTSYMKRNHLSTINKMNLKYLPYNLLIYFIPIFELDEEIFNFFLCDKFLILSKDYFSLVINVNEIVFFYTFLLRKLRKRNINNKSNDLDVKKHLDAIISKTHEILTYAIEKSLVDKCLYLFISLIEEFINFEFENFGYHLMISNLFKNYFVSFFGPSIRFILVDFYEKIENITKTGRPSNSILEIENEDQEEYIEMSFVESEEYLFWNKLVLLISIIYNKKNCDNEYYLEEDPFSWIDLLFLNNIDFSVIFPQLDKKSFVVSIRFAEGIIDFYSNLLSNSIIFNNDLYKNHIEKNPSFDPDDHFLNLFWEKYGDSDYNLMIIKMSNFIFDLDYFFSQKIDNFNHLDLDLRVKFISKYLNLLKILFKYFRYLIYTKNNNNYANLVNKCDHPLESKLYDYLIKLRGFSKTDTLDLNNLNLSNKYLRNSSVVNNKFHLIDLLILQFLSLIDEISDKEETKSFLNDELTFQIDSIKKNFLSIDFYVKLNINIEILTAITVRYRYIEYINNPLNQSNTDYSSKIGDVDKLAQKLSNKDNMFNIENYHIIMKYIYNVESAHMYNISKNEKFKFNNQTIYSSSISHYFSQINTEKINFLSLLDFEGDFNDNLTHFNYSLWNYIDLFGFSDFVSLVGHDLNNSLAIDNKFKIKDRFKNFFETEHIYEKILKELETNFNNSNNHNSRFKYQPNNLWYIKYYNDYTDLIHFFIKFEDFQKLYNDHILTRNTNLTIIFIYNMIFYSQSFFRTELLKKERKERKKCFRMLIKTFEIIKIIFQDNKYKSLIDQLKLNFVFFKDADFGIILHLIIHFANYKINSLFDLIIDSGEELHINNLNFKIILSECNILTKKSIDLFTEFNQGSLNYLTNNIKYLIDTIKIILSDFDYETFINNNSILEKVLDFKFQGYLLLKFACDELTTLPHFLNSALKNYDMNILKKDFIMANVAAENLIKNYLIKNNMAYDKELPFFELIKVYWGLIEQEFVYKMCRSIFIVIKYLNEVYDILEFEDFFKADKKFSNLLESFNYMKKKSKKAKKKGNILTLKDFDLSIKSSINDHKEDGNTTTLQFHHDSKTVEDNSPHTSYQKFILDLKEENLGFKKKLTSNLDKSKLLKKENSVTTTVNVNYKMRTSIPKAITFVENDPNLQKYQTTKDILSNDQGKSKILEAILSDKETIKRLINFYDLITRHIEIFYSPDYMNLDKNECNMKQNLRKIFFEINPFYFNLSNSTKQYFLSNCDRTSQITKLSELIDNTDFFKKEIEYFSQNPSNMKRLLKLINFKVLEIFLFFTTLFVNFIFLRSFKIQDDIININWDLWIIIKLITLFQIGTCFGILYVWHKDKHLIYYNALITKNQKNLTLLKKFRYYFIDSFLDKNEVNSFLFVLILSILSFIKSNAYYITGIQVASLINLNKYLRNVIAVLRKRFQQIIQTMILLLTLIYMYSLIGFYFFNAEYNDPDLKENRCQDLIQCYLTHISYGIRSGGGIGDQLPRHYFGRGNKSELYRMVFDLLWFFIVNLLMLNIILGVIVDTFKELRQENDSHEYDRENVCFVCGIDKNKARSLGLDFYEHVNKDHDMWNYAFFLINLQNLQGKDMNTYELYVDNQIKNQNISFFPEMICTAMLKKSSN